MFVFLVYLCWILFNWIILQRCPSRTHLINVLIFNGLLTKHIFEILFIILFLLFWRSILIILLLVSFIYFMKLFFFSLIKIIMKKRILRMMISMPPCCCHLVMFLKITSCNRNICLLLIGLLNSWKTSIVSKNYITT